MSVKDSIFEDYLNFKEIEYSYYSNDSFEIDGCKVYTMNDTSNYSFNNFDSNNKSGIIKFVYGNTSFLFVGDAEHEAEEYLMSRYREFLNSDVLKVGHHGSKTSTSDLFLDIVKPKIGIISAGLMNKFKHPSKSVISKLKERNIIIRRTDYEGAVILTSNGESINSIDWRNF
jgi:competence protein ComEC